MKGGIIGVDFFLSIYGLELLTRPLPLIFVFTMSAASPSTPFVSSVEGGMLKEGELGEVSEGVST